MLLALLAAIGGGVAFLIVAALVVIAGFVAQYVAPGARTLGEVLMLLR